jgi:hypothetical protein
MEERNVEWLWSIHRVKSAGFRRVPAIRCSGFRLFRLHTSPECVCVIRGAPRPDASVLQHECAPVGSVTLSVVPSRRYPDGVAHALQVWIF